MPMFLTAGIQPTFGMGNSAKPWNRWEPRQAFSEAGQRPEQNAPSDWVSALAKRNCPDSKEHPAWAWGVPSASHGCPGRAPGECQGVEFC